MQGLADFITVPAGPGDAAALGRVHVAAWRETYAGLLPQAYLDAMHPALQARRFSLQLKRPSEVVLAAEGRDGLAGYCAGEVRGAEAEVSTLYILRRAQGLGLGRRLLGDTARVLAGRDAKSLRLWVLDGNTRAERFYAGLGGERVGERPARGWGPGYHEILYRWPDIGRLI